MSRRCFGRCGNGLGIALKTDEVTSGREIRFLSDHYLELFDRLRKLTLL